MDNIIEINDVVYFDCDSLYFCLTNEASETIYRQKEIICSYSGANEWCNNFVCQLLDLYSGASIYNYALGTYKHEERFKELLKENNKQKAIDFVKFTVNNSVYNKMYANFKKIVDDLENWDDVEDY